jgi:HAD superfamily hydrolase (TIGR01509 family)
MPDGDRAADSMNDSEKEETNVSASLLRRILAILVDLDNVIVLTELFHMMAHLAALTESGVTSLPPEWYETFLMGRKSSIGLAELLEHLGLSHIDPETVLATKLQRYLEIIDTELTETVDGILDLLRAAKARGIPAALVTSGTPAEVAVVWDRFQLGEIFDVVVTGDMVVNSKPDPEPYQLALELLASKFGDEILVDDGMWVAFEDSVPGVRAAVGADAECIGVTTSHESSILELAGAILTVGPPIDLSLLDRLESLPATN